MATTGIYKFMKSGASIYCHYDNYEYGAAEKILAALNRAGYDLATEFIRANEEAEIVNSEMYKPNYIYTIDEKSKIIMVYDDYRNKTNSYTFEEFFDKFAGKICNECGSRAEDGEYDMITRSLTIRCKCGAHEGRGRYNEDAYIAYNESF